MFEWVSKPPPSTYLRQDQGDNKCVVLPNLNYDYISVRDWVFVWSATLAD